MIKKCCTIDVCVSLLGDVICSCEIAGLLLCHLFILTFIYFYLFYFDKVGKTQNFPVAMLNMGNRKESCKEKIYKDKNNTMTK